MQEENQNNNKGWRSRIHALDSLPGEPAPVYSTAWQQLRDRLEPKKRHHKPVWWFIAAACTVLIVFLLAVREPQKSASNEVARRASTTQPGVIEEIAPPKILLHQRASTVRIKSTHPKKVFPRVKPQLPVAKKDSTIEIQTPPIETSIESADVVKSDTPLILPATKLRVMHINELDPTAEEQQRKWVQGENKKTKHSNSNNLIKSYVSNSTSDKVLKITISPAN